MGRKQYLGSIQGIDKHPREICITGIPKETETANAGMEVEAGREHQNKINLPCNMAVGKAQQACHFAQTEETL